MPNETTHLKFAQYAARLASLAAQWSADALIEVEVDADTDPMRPDVLRRYVKDVRRFLELVDPDGTSA